MTKEIMPKDVTMPEISMLFPAYADESYLLVGCQRRDYSASAISRAVEDCNAQVLNLNVTSIDNGPEQVVVALRINHRNPQPVVHSLSRYGFEVLEASSIDEGINDDMRMRVNQLLRMLEL